MADQSSIRGNDIFFSPIEQQVEESPLETNIAGTNLEELERKAIKSAIERFNGNISKAAKELGLTRAALYRRLEKYDI
ncbi:DNA-binding transcriptional regulator DhaR [compost metagenome]